MVIRDWRKTRGMRESNANTIHSTERYCRELEWYTRILWILPQSTAIMEQGKPFWNAVSPSGTQHVTASSSRRKKGCQWGIGFCPLSNQRPSPDFVVLLMQLGIRLDTSRKNTFGVNTETKIAKNHLKNAVRWATYQPNNNDRRGTTRPNQPTPTPREAMGVWSCSVPVQPFVQ